MAITVQDEPLIISPVHNPIEYLTSTDKSAEANYKTKVFVHYDPAGANTRLAILPYPVRPGTTQVISQVDRILAGKINWNVTNVISNASGIQTETDFHCAKVAFQDFYGTPPTNQGSPVSGTTFCFWNASFKTLQYKALDPEDYIMLQGGAVEGYKFLTGFDNTGTLAFSFSNNFRPITKDQWLRLGFIYKFTSATAVNINIEGYDQSGTGNYSLTFTKTGLSSPVMLSVNLNKTAIDSGLTSATVYLRVSMFPTGEPVASEYYWFSLDWTPCTKYEDFEIHWLNRYGYFDSHIFGKVHRHTTEAEKRVMTRQTRGISGSAITDPYYANKRPVFSTNTKEKYTVNSDIVPEWFNEGFEDLITSPQIFWRTDEGFRAINILENTNFEHKTSVTDKAFNLQFSFEIDNEDIRQRL